MIENSGHLLKHNVLKVHIYSLTKWAQNTCISLSQCFSDYHKQETLCLSTLCGWQQDLECFWAHASYWDMSYSGRNAVYMNPCSIIHSIISRGRICICNLSSTIVTHYPKYNSYLSPLTRNVMTYRWNNMHVALNTTAVSWKKSKSEHNHTILSCFLIKNVHLCALRY